MKIIRSSIHFFRKKHHHVKIIFFTCLIALSSSSLYLYYVNFATTENLLLRDAVGQQMLLEHVGKQSIMEFFTIAEKELYALSTAPSIQEQVPGFTQSRLDDLMQKVVDKDSPIFSLFFLNTQGTVTAVSNQAGNQQSLGQNFSDRDYFIWTKDPTHKGKMYISSPFVSRGNPTKGQSIIMVATSVYSASGKYQGTLAALITFDRFVETFIKPLARNNPEFWLLDKNGVLLAGGDGDEQKSMNMLDYAKKIQWDGSSTFANSLQQALQSPETILHGNYKTVNGQVKEVYGSSITIQVGNQSFVLLIFNTKGQILKPLDTPLAVSIIPIIAVITTFLIGLVFTLTSRLATQDGFIDGYNAAKKQLEKK